MKLNFGFLVLLFLSQLSIAQDKMDAYLFAYFEGTGKGELQEQLRFAVSADAQNWKALNSNQPIIGSDTISNSGGIRDPHILRNDGQFFIVATDMFTIKHGWGSNPGIVLMHSKNLTDWEANAIDFQKEYPDTFKNVQWVWAPQTFYDKDNDKYLVYFTIRFS